MVREEGGIKYKCPYCSEEFDDYEEADECAKECAMIERDLPDEVEEPRFYCEYCEKKHISKHRAEDCENEHIQKQDRFYEEHEQKESMIRLLKASEHPKQKSLAAFKIMH